MSVLLLIFNHLLPFEINLAVFIPLIAACESVLILTLVSVGMANITVHMAVNSALVDDGHFSTFPFIDILGSVSVVQPKPILVFVSSVSPVIRDPSV